MGSDVRSKPGKAIEPDGHKTSQDQKPMKGPSNKRIKT